MTSCSDQDGVKDVDLSRVLMPYNLSAIADQMEPAITVSWDGTNNAQYYVVEAFLDDPDFEGIPVVTKEVYGTECVLEDLLGETMYNIRVKGVAEGKEDSHWAIINRATAPEQILSVPYNDIQETSITITWPTRKEINAYKVFLNGSVIQSGSISSDEAAAGEKVITGLTGGTTYTFEVYLDEKRRGYIDETTEIGAPTDCDYTVNLTPTTLSNEYTMQDILDEIATQAATDGKSSYSVAVMIPGGDIVYPFKKVKADGSTDNLLIPDGMSLIVYGDKDNKPYVNIECTQVNVTGNHDLIAFRKVNLTGAKYFLNQSAACNIGKLEFTLCNIAGFTGNTFIRTQGSNNPTFGTIEVNKCVINGCASNYSIFDLRKATITNVNIKNTTVMNSATNGKNLVQADTSLKNLTINACTFYNICGNNQAFLALGNTGEKVVVSNCLFAKSADANATESKLGGTLTVSNCYNANDWVKPLTGMTALDTDMMGLFYNPENGDFTVNEDYIELGAGDPRWLP